MLSHSNPIDEYTGHRSGPELLYWQFEDGEVKSASSTKQKHTLRRVTAPIFPGKTLGEAVLAYYRLQTANGNPGNYTLTMWLQHNCLKAIGYRNTGPQAYDRLPQVCNLEPAIIYVNRGKGDLQRIDLGRTPEKLIQAMENGTV